MSLAAAGERGFSSTLGVSTISSSSLAVTFAAVFLEDDALGFAAFFLLEGSEAGVFGVDSFNFVLVFGVFAVWE